MKNSKSFKESITMQVYLKCNTQVILIQSRGVPYPCKYGEIIAVLPHMKCMNIWMLLATRENIKGVRQLIPGMDRLSGDYEPAIEGEVEKSMLDWITKIRPRDIEPAPVIQQRCKLTKRPKLPTVLLVEEAKTQWSWTQVAQNQPKKAPIRNKSKQNMVPDPSSAHTI
jgi:hypothetical protein